MSAEKSDKGSLDTVDSALPRMAPRCVDRAGAAAYLSVSEDVVDRLIQTGAIEIVRLPVERHRKTGRGVRGVCRRILIDLRSLDRLIELSKERRG